MGDGAAGIKMPTGVLSSSGNDSEVGQTVGNKDGFVTPDYNN